MKTENITTAKILRHIAWMNAHTDPTKTPVELWEASKVALKEVDK